MALKKPRPPTGRRLESDKGQKSLNRDAAFDSRDHSLFVFFL
jgi:hypothetical protein